MLDKLISAEPVGAPVGERFYGLLPALRLRFEQGRPEVLAELDSKSRVLNEWAVFDNSAHCEFLAGHRVALLEGYPRLNWEVAEAGAFPQAIRGQFTAPGLAAALLGDVSWI